LKVGKNDRKVENLFVDLRDGLLLIKLLENLSKKKVNGFKGQAPRTEAHKMVNLDLAFQFMKTESIKMVGVGEQKGGRECRYHMASRVGSLIST
jgi:hypothetical protein